MSDDRNDGAEQELRQSLPGEVYAAEADWVRLAMKRMTARRMIGWLRGFATYMDAADNDVTADDARAVAARLEAEVESEEIRTDGGQPAKEETGAGRDPFDGAIGMTARPMDYGADDVQEPERDIESVTETLSAVEAGDNLKLGIGVDDGDGLTGGTMYPRVESVERDVGGFDVRLNLLHNVGDDGWGRLYITGYGNDGSDLDEWEIVSMPYHVPTETGDMRDFAAHGWVVGAEVDNAE